ncbi:MAG: alpha-hydroxy-acid oxidizing protein [Firmicutes bacterium]|nr:alpha-hydroxy-acid oxidizing protein [Bacillota bacterium]
MSTYGPDTQLEIYGATSPQTKGLPIAYEDWRRRAQELLEDAAFWYVAGGAGEEATMRANREAFSHWSIRPHMLCDVSSRDLHVDVLGTPLPAPLLLAPVGVLSIVHPFDAAASISSDEPAAELAVAAASAETGIPMILSSVSSTPMETVAASLAQTPRWFQCYPAKDREILYSFAHRAEAAGFGALVVTVDTTLLGWRTHDLERAYLPFLQGNGVANYFTDPAFRAELPQPPEVDPSAAIRHFLNVYVNPSFTWESLADLRNHTSLPILIKGITHPDDALQALDLGMDGIIVSNHGGRQVDGAVAALDALPEIVDRVEGRLPVLFDSGIRHAADIVKALALGASAVLIGRPYVWGLAVAGARGVQTVLRNLIAELDLQLALSGITSVAQCDRSLLCPTAHRNP